MTNLISLIQESKDGEWGKDKPFNDSVKMAVIRGADFDNVRIGKIDDLPVRYIPRRIAERKQLNEFDIVLETAGGATDRPTGRSLIIKPSVIRKSSLPLICASFSRFIRIDPEKADSQYIYWLLQYLYEMGYLHKFNTQHTGVSRFQYTVFAKGENFKIHSYPTQQKIAAILSAYDDLIVNNTRRIEILEEMAETLYYEWFVRYHFPGHEQVKMVEYPEIGKMPEGWEVKPVGDAFEITGGGTPSTDNPQYWNPEEILWYIPSDITTSNRMFISESEKKISKFGFENSSARLFPPYSVMMTSRATIGEASINTKEACTNQGFITCIPNHRVSVYQIYFWIKENKDLFIRLSTGATFGEITKKTFRQILFVVAPESLSSKFLEIMKPLGEEIYVLQEKNKNLRETRDLLLPMLISGELDVSDVDIAV